MSVERGDPTDPMEWLRRARSNLASAGAGRFLPEVLYEDLCLDAQQAAEKAIKAILVHRKTPTPTGILSLDTCPAGCIIVEKMFLFPA